MNKLLLSLLLIVVGFFGASMFGPPDLADRVMGRWNGPAIDTSQGLHPLPSQLLAQSGSEQSSAVEPTLPDFSWAAAPCALPVSDQSTDLSVSGWSDPRDAQVKLTAAKENLDPIAASPSAPAWGSWSAPEVRLTAKPTPVKPTPVQSAWGTPPALIEPALESSWQDPAWQARRAEPVRNEPLREEPLRHEPVRRIASQASPAAERSHVVTDGDTLMSIAKRYLGREDRAEELYELNRDRLDHPDLLPIGVMLRVPIEPRRPAAREAPPPIDPWGAPSFGNPFQTISKSARRGEGSAARPSELAPVGEVAEPEASFPPQGQMASDWSW